MNPPPIRAPGTAPTALSVNVNKVALLRNTRHLGIPGVTRAARCCLAAGAHGITVHPRPDARHIRAQDVDDVHAVVKSHPGAELNIEGNPLHNLMDFVRRLRPQQATFVPDAQGQFTSDHGWCFPQDLDTLRPLVAECRRLGVRVSLFMDPIPEQIRLAAGTGAQRVELYTEPYARARGTAQQEAQLQACAAAARAAQESALEVNAGHDLNLENLPDFVRGVPGLREVSIGHAFIADALEMGYAAAVHAYLRCLSPA